MNVIDHLATSLGRRDEVPNQELAIALAASGDTQAVNDLAALLKHKDKNIRHDAIKTLYELGERNPAMIAPYAAEFVTLLHDKNNRMVWGAMTAISTIAALNPGPVHAALPAIIATADAGTVITNDRCVITLAGLCQHAQYADEAFTLLLERILKSPVNQLPQYAEKAQPVAPAAHKPRLKAILEQRLGELTTDAKRKRVEKVLRKL
ncbi:MAG: HEAT repeat domain-containing protein [Bacteroidia bacterium]